MRLSLIIPTRNRAHLWRDGWAMKTILAQSSPPDELIIACDNPDDDTIDAVRAATSNSPFPVRVLDLIAGRPGPSPAAAVPDNCLFHAATGDIILHMDDDCRLHPGACERIRALLQDLPRSIIWLKSNFVQADGTPLVDYPRVDSRLAQADRFNWPKLPGGIIQLPPTRVVHWGAAWAVPLRELRAIGGHCLATAQFRNTDTRLGSRLVAAGCSSFVGNCPELSSDHLGPTWLVSHKNDAEAIRQSRGPYSGRTIANGGPNFWTSDWIRAAYKELDTA